MLVASVLAASVFARLWVDGAGKGLSAAGLGAGIGFGFVGRVGRGGLDFQDVGLEVAETKDSPSSEVIASFAASVSGMVPG